MFLLAIFRALQTNFDSNSTLLIESGLDVSEQIVHEPKSAGKDATESDDIPTKIENKFKHEITQIEPAGATEFYL